MMPMGRIKSDAHRKIGEAVYQLPFNAVEKHHAALAGFPGLAEDDPAVVWSSLDWIPPHATTRSRARRIRIERLA
jgi:hypothetical protein